MHTVLVIEDEPNIASIIRTCIEKDGHSCAVSYNGNHGWDEFIRIQPDLVILDLNLPGMSGLEVCTRIRRVNSTGKDPYILMLTAQSSELDRIIGFSTGADDYIPKPFNPQELIVRVRALFRRDLNKRSDDKHLIETAHLKIDRERREVWMKSEGRSPTRIKLPVTEFDLLVVLASGKAGRVWERGELLDAVWGEHFIGDSQIVTSYIRRLRSKLTFDTGELLPCIKTHTGIGYSFEDTDI